MKPSGRIASIKVPTAPLTKPSLFEIFLVNRTLQPRLSCKNTGSLRYSCSFLFCSNKCRSLASSAFPVLWCDAHIVRIGCLLLSSLVELCWMQEAWKGNKCVASDQGGTVISILWVLFTRVLSSSTSASVASPRRIRFIISTKNTCSGPDCRC